MTQPVSRLPPLRKDEMSAEQLAIYDEVVAGPFGRYAVDADGVVVGPGMVLLHHPALTPPSYQFAKIIQLAGHLPHRARVIVILSVAVAWKSEFYWMAHSRIGRSAGLGEAELEDLRASRLTLDDPVERAALRTAEALLKRADLDDQEYADAAAALTTQQLIEVVTLVGQYEARALQLRVFRIGLPAGVAPVFSD